MAWTVAEYQVSLGWNGTNAGKDIGATYLDNDGVSGWFFQYSNPGFARINLTDNTNMFVGLIWNDSSTGQTEFLEPAGSPLWVQDSANNYYTAYSGSHNSNVDTLYKLSVGSSSVTDLGNGYLQTLGSFSFPGAFGSIVGLTQGFYPDMYRVWDNGGTTYFGCSPARYILMVNATTMAAVGKYDAGSFTWANSGTFIDDSGNFWAVFHSTGSSGSFRFVKWNPADGATGGALNVTVNTVTNAALSLTNANNCFATFIPGTNSFILSNDQTSEFKIISLADFSVVATHTPNPDVTFMTPDSGVSFGRAGNLWANSIPARGDGKWLINGALNPEGTQYGGIGNFVDQSTLTVLETLNITDTINTQSDPVPFNSGAGMYEPLTSLSYNYFPVAQMAAGFALTNRWILVTYSNSSGSPNYGSYAYLLFETVTPPAATVYPVVFVSTS